LKKTSIEQKMVNLGCGSKLGVGPKLDNFFAPSKLLLAPREAQMGKKKKAKLRPGSELGPKPKLSLFSFCSIQASFGADRS
jgi:hypothetical protein